MRISEEIYKKVLIVQNCSHALNSCIKTSRATIELWGLRVLHVLGLTIAMCAAQMLIVVTKKGYQNSLNNALAYMFACLRSVVKRR
jgi:hypothetical protein